MIWDKKRFIDFLKSLILGTLCFLIRMLIQGKLYNLGFRQPLTMDLIVQSHFK